MAANARVNWAVVETGAAPDALQGLAPLVVGINFRAPIVQDDQMHFFGTVFLVFFAGRGDHVHIGGDQLAGGGTDQQPHHGWNILQLFDNFFQPHKRNVDRRGGGAHAAVAFIFHQEQGAGFSNCKVDAAQPDVGLIKFLAQCFARNGIELLDIFRIGRVR